MTRRAPRPVSERTGAPKAARRGVEEDRDEGVREANVPDELVPGGTTAMTTGDAATAVTDAHVGAAPHTTLDVDVSSSTAAAERADGAAAHVEVAADAAILDGASPNGAGTALDDGLVATVPFEPDGVEPDGLEPDGAEPDGAEPGAIGPGRAAVVSDGVIGGDLPGGEDDGARDPALLEPALLGAADAAFGHRGGEGVDVVAEDVLDADVLDAAVLDADTLDEEGDETAIDPAAEFAFDSEDGTGSDEEDEDEVDDVGVPFVPPQSFELLRFVEVAVVLPATNPILVLEWEANPDVQLRIPIGTPEGVAIAYAARHLGTPRPLTHELTINLLEAYNLMIEAVRITAVSGAAYEAEIVCGGPGGMQTIPCRPSDGVALALRQRLPAPILAAPEVLEVAGVDVGAVGEG